MKSLLKNKIILRVLAGFMVGAAATLAFQPAARAATPEMVTSATILSANAY